MNYHSQNPTLTVFVGPMWSGKTTKLLATIERAELQHKKVLLFKPSIDDRYSSSDVVSHAGWRRQATVVKESVDILEALTNAEEPPDVVAVDEAFMVTGVADVLIWLYRTGISVIVSSLDLSATCKPFHEIEKLLPWATYIEKCPAVCVNCGRDAFYTHKKVMTESSEIDVGGAELYESRCYACHVIVDNRPNIC